MVKGLAWKTLLVALLAYALLVASYVGLVPFFREMIIGLDLLSQPIKFEFRGQRQPSPELKVIGITEHTIGVFKTRPNDPVYYPFEWQWHAAAITRLADAGAKVIVFDILFSSDAEENFGDEDEVPIRDAVNYARSKGCEVVMAAGIEDVDIAAGVTSQTLVLPAEAILEAGPHLGLSNAVDKLGYKQLELISRSLDLPGLEQSTFYTQAVEAFRLLQEDRGESWEDRLDEASAARLVSREQAMEFFRINYCGDLSWFPGTLYHYEGLFTEDELLEGAELVQGSPGPQDRLSKVFNGAVVFVGGRNKADNDYFNTPYGQMFGVDTNAQAFDTLLTGELISGVPPVSTLLISLGLTLLAWLLSQLRPIGKSIIVAGLAFIAVFAGVLFLFSLFSVELSLTLTTTGFLLPFSACIIYGGVAEELAKRRIRGTFSRYVSGEIVDQIIADPSLAHLGGVERQVAVLFTDIRSYSTITEPLSPAEIVEFLNRFLGRATEIVMQHHGFVDKYLGDGLMAVFGGPVPTENPANDAIDCALEMVAALHEDQSKADFPDGLPRFRIGVGVHFGNVVMGNIGSQVRMDYTVIGDAVNVASRVEGLTKDEGWAVLVTGDALQAAGGQFIAHEMGERQVKGRARPVAVHAVVREGAEELYKY